jgi:hypothetical protein
MLGGRAFVPRFDPGPGHHDVYAGEAYAPLAVAQRVLDADLDVAIRLIVAKYHVLVLLSEQSDHAMRMSELAAQASSTASGLIRVVEPVGNASTPPGTSKLTK